MPGEGEIYMPGEREKSPAMLALEQDLRKTMVDSRTIHERMRMQMSHSEKPQTTLEQAIHQQRVGVDQCIKDTQKLATTISRGTGGREVALSITKLQEAKMWLGKALEELGSPLPEEYRDEAH